jgi:acyl carrier protein
LYILDKYGKLLPYGVAGELCIAGVGVARGYLNNPQLTGEKFIPDAFAATGSIYRTGDLTRLLPDGNVEYLQRMDHQVKIRGLRIELGEIEAQLATHPAVQENVVVVKEKQGEKYLTAYYVSDGETGYAELRAFLADKLPDYMVPAFGLRLEQMPLTRNGKLDRNALPDPEITKGHDYVGPASEVEEKLAAIWSELLGIDKAVISVNKSFFELGGQSLKAVSLTAQIEKAFNVKIPLMSIFMKPTIRELERNILITNLSKKQRTTLSKVTV